MRPVQPRVEADTIPAVLGADQPEYLPLPARLTNDGQVITEWEPDDQERADLYRHLLRRTLRIRIVVLKGEAPLQPLRVEVPSAD